MIHIRRLAVPIASLAVLVLSLVADDAVAQGVAVPEPQFYPSPDSVLKRMPFSEAVRVGNMLYVSGQIGSLPGTLTLAPGGIGPETRQTFQNIAAILERHGASLKDVVKCTVYLADIGEWGAFNAVYREFFSAPYPARSALGGAALVFGAREEVECVAVVPAE